MAGFSSIGAVGKSIERSLNAGFDEEQSDSSDPLSWLVPQKKTKAILVKTSDFEEANRAANIGSPALSIFLYRVDFNKTMRAAWSAVGNVDGRGHLAVDLHFLITPWADLAEYEHRILGKAMQYIETIPILTGPLLYSDRWTHWMPNESVQLMLEEISTEAVMRTFDSLPTDYRLSVPYIARIVRIDSKTAKPDIPVTDLVTGIKPSADDEPLYR